MAAIRRRAGSSRRYLERKASKLHRPRMCDSSAPGTSKGVAPVRPAVAMTASPGTNMNSAVRSMKRLMSHGQAIRSIFGRSRVTHCMSLPPLTGERHCRRADRVPGCDAARQVPCVETAAPQFGDCIAADLEAIDAIGDDRLAARQVRGPGGDRFRGADLRVRQHVRTLGEVLGEADVENENVLAALKPRAQVF